MLSQKKILSGLHQGSHSNNGMTVVKQDRMGRGSREGEGGAGWKEEGRGLGEAAVSISVRVAARKAVHFCRLSRCRRVTTIIN